MGGGCRYWGRGQSADVLTFQFFLPIPGGLTAVMYTDTAQSIIIVIGAFVVMTLSK